jgi:hypothetical protein
MLPHTTSSSQTATKRFVRVNPKLEKQLGAYAAAVGATAVAVVAAASPASAKIVYTPVNVEIGSSYAIDLNGDGTSDFTLRRCYCAGSHTSFLMVALDVPGNAVRLALDSEVFAGALPVGAFIDKKQQFGTKTSYGGLLMAEGFYYGTISNQGGPWINATNKYLGFKFMIDGEVHYGWARLTVGSFKVRDRDVTLTGYAYETVPGRMIHAGQKTETDVETNSPDIDSTPESTLGMLALGANGRNASVK